MQFQGKDVEHTDGAVARRAAGLFDDEAERIRFVQQPKLSLR